MQLVRQRQPLGVETVLRRRLAGPGRFLDQRPLQRLAGAQRLPGDQRPEHQRVYATTSTGPPAGR